jgi:hypothetical protein
LRRVPVGAGASAEGADTAGVHAMVGGFWLGLSDWGGRAGGARTNGQGLVVSVVFELSEGREGRERERPRNNSISSAALVCPCFSLGLDGKLDEAPAQ